MLLSLHRKVDQNQILDCLRGLQYAILLGWFDIKKFDITEYEHYEQIENGDLNWVIPGKFLTEPKYGDCTFYHFTSPHYKKYVNAVLLACSYMVCPPLSRSS